MGFNDEQAKDFFKNAKRLTASVTVQRGASEVYKAWKDPVTLPRLFEGVEAVAPAGENQTQWRARAGNGEVVECDAEIINDAPDRLIAWRSEGEHTANAGSVTIRELPFCRGTEVKVVIDYIPSGGASDSLLSIASKDPERYLRTALFRFRQLLETGEIATTKGQPAGRNDGSDPQGSKDERKVGGAKEPRS